MKRNTILVGKEGYIELHNYERVQDGKLPYSKEQEEREWARACKWIDNKAIIMNHEFSWRKDGKLVFQTLEEMKDILNAKSIKWENYELECFNL